MPLEDDVLARLRRYLDLLLEANRRINLTAVREPEAAWHRLILDSLTLLPGVEPLEAGSRVVDIGSGGGLPGVPLAIARPDLRFTLLEATGKKVRFLLAVAETLGLANVQVVQGRAEAVGHEVEHRGRYDLAVCRAVGRISEVLEYAMPLLREGGQLLAMKASQAERELDEAGDALAILGAGDVAVVEAYPESFGQELVIISVVKSARTPAEYPRRPGLPRHEPL